MSEPLTETVLRQLRFVREEHEAQKRKLVTRARRSGTRSHDIARSLNISRATLWRHYADELGEGAAGWRREAQG